MRWMLALWHIGQDTTQSIGISKGAPAVLPLIQPPTNAAGKEPENGPSVQAPVPTWGNSKRLMAFDFRVAQPWLFQAV